MVFVEGQTHRPMELNKLDQKVNTHNKDGKKNSMAPCAKVTNLHLKLMPHTKISSKWIMGLNSQCTI